jgi:hypothetical protein
MATPHPSRRPARPPTPATTRAHPRPPRRPRRWGRLLVLGLVLALVALFGARALADDGDGGVSFFESGEASGTQSRQPQTEQPQIVQAQTEQPPTDVAGNTKGNGGDSPSADGTPQVPSQIGGDQPETAAANTQTEALVGGDQPAVRQQPGQGGKDSEHSGPGGCVSDGCSKPPLPGSPNAAAAGGGGPGDDDLLEPDSRWDDIDLLQHDPQSPLQEQVHDLFFEVIELDDNVDLMVEAGGDYDPELHARMMAELGQSAPTEPFGIIGEHLNDLRENPAFGGSGGG